MKSLILSLLLATTLLNAACTSIQSVPIDKDQPGRYLKKGEPVTVYLNNGEVHSMLVGKTTATQVIGSEPSAPFNRLAFNYDDISDIKGERVDVPRTAGATLAGIVLVPIYAAFLLMSEGDWCFNNC